MLMIRAYMFLASFEGSYKLIQAYYLPEGQWLLQENLAANSEQNLALVGHFQAAICSESCSELHGIYCETG